MVADDKSSIFLKCGTMVLPLHYWRQQCLASTNHNFMLTETRRGYLRYIGGLTYFEVTWTLSRSVWLHPGSLLAIQKKCAGSLLQIKHDGQKACICLSVNAFMHAQGLSAELCNLSFVAPEYIRLLALLCTAIIWRQLNAWAWVRAHLVTGK